MSDVLPFPDPKFNGNVYFIGFGKHYKDISVDDGYKGQKRNNTMFYTTSADLN